MIKYISTRGGGEPQTFEQVLLAGLAPDGGLYMPQSWPKIDLTSLKDKSYVDVAEAVMFPFVEGCVEKADFRKMLEETYTESVFQHPDLIPLYKVSNTIWALELFHGPTAAFKDVALQLLGHLFDYVLKKRGEHSTVIGATSGDTGAAAIEGCRHSDNLDIFIFFPQGRVSDVQRRQMTTVKAPNVHTVAVQGTFDDCQALVKSMFADKDFRAKHNLSAVNSINWARIMAQIVYYVNAGAQLGAHQRDLSFVVPTGNFGNVFAAYAARQMGMPIKTLALATNKNDILTRFFETGTMELADVEPTLSPSMDIQVSSNFERYLFELLGRDTQKLVALMKEFKEKGSFSLSEELMQKARKEFSAFRSDEAQTMTAIKDIYDTAAYTLDPHTAVGYVAALELEKINTGSVIVLATAHPGKFPDAVEAATGDRPPLPMHLKGLMEREEHVKTLPNDLKTVQDYIASAAKG